MRALITGDRGFLGRHFMAELKRQGYTITGLDVKASSAQDCREYFRYGVRHAYTVDRLKLDQWDLVVHCAAVIGGRETIERDPLVTAENLSIDAEMFRWAAVARPGRVIYFSSSAAYPVSLQSGEQAGRLSEDWIQLWAPGNPDEVYGWSKVTGELLADRLRRTGVPVTVVRPFSGYGMDQDETYPFRAILERVKRREDPLVVWSDTVRDFVHVDDLVAGTLAVAESETEKPVNLCTGRATSFTGLARMMADAAGYDPEIKVLDNRPKGVAYRVGDPNRMLLGYYTPKISLEQGIKRALGDGS